MQAAQHYKALGAAAAVAGEHVPEDHKRECAAFERVAMQNRLACMVAERALSGGTTLDLAFEFQQHRSFPVAVLKSRKVS